MPARRRAAAAMPGSTLPPAARLASSCSRSASTTWSRKTRRSRPRSSRRSRSTMPAPASPPASASTNPSTSSASARPRRSRTASASMRPAVEPKQLVQDGLRVAHAPGGQAGDHADRLGVRLAAVGREDPLELAGDLGDGEAADVEPLEPRQDRRREVLRVGRREHEGHEVRRLLERLEERVPGVLRDLVGLVEDVDLAPEVRGRVVQALAQLADVVDAAVGRGIDLDQVQRPALADGVARVTRVAGIGVGRERLAVEGLGQDPRQGRLAGAARTREQDRVRHLARDHGVAERGDDRLLPDDLRERLGAPSAVEGLVGGPLGQLQLLDAPAAGRGRVGSAVHPPSMRTSPRPAAHATRTRPFRGTRQSALSAASFRT